jgi:hypothetical protein
MKTAAEEFIQSMKHPVKFRMFLLYKLPSAFFAGVRIKSLDVQQCETIVPYKWFTQNPFRSTYFACLAMAAEMSTGVLALTQLHKREPPVSMLVVKLEADYFKKAVGKTIFQCTDGDLLKQAIEKAISTGEGQVFRATSIGINEQGEKIATFYVTWSFKSRLKK